MNVIPKGDERETASEARHGAWFMRNKAWWASAGWVSGLNRPEDTIQMARILSGRGMLPRYCNEWREPDWPIYRAAVCG